MDSEAKAAFVVAQAACANAEIAAMQAENAAGIEPRWTGQDFRNVPDRYQLGWNAVIEYLRG